MKKIQFFSFVVVAMTALALFSCNKNDDSGTPGGPADYTVLFYGTGDGALDYTVADVLKSMMSQGANDKYQMVFMYTPDNVSVKYVPDLKHTYRLAIGNAVRIEAKGDLSQAVSKDDSSRVTANYLYEVIHEGIEKGAFSYVDITDPVQLYNPANISSFLNLGAEKCPAKNYLLAVSGHGGGWSIDQEYFKEYTKAVAWDENFTNPDLGKSSNPITARELGQGIRNSKLKGNVSVYMDACTMNAIENVWELAKDGGALYYIASFYETLDGNNYPTLRRVLESESNPYNAYVRFRDSLVLNRCVDFEQSVWELSKISELSSAIEYFVDTLIQDYKPYYPEKKPGLTKEQYYNSLVKGLAYPNSNDRDFSEFIDTLRRAFDYDHETITKAECCDTGVVEAAKVVWAKLNAAVDTKYRTDSGVKISKKSPAMASCYFVNKVTYQSDVEKYGEKVITESAFSEQTGWNNFLKKLSFE